jgi:excisionase family DNA binding protein
MTSKLPALIMTPEEIEAAEEAFIQGEQDFLDRQKERKQPIRTEREPRLLNTEQAAKYLAISPWKLRIMVHDGKIPCVRGKYWKFDTHELDIWIRENQERER